MRRLILRVHQKAIRFPGPAQVAGPGHFPRTAPSGDRVQAQTGSAGCTAPALTQPLSRRVQRAPVRGRVARHAGRWADLSHRERKRSGKASRTRCSRVGQAGHRRALPVCRGGGRNLPVALDAASRGNGTVRPCLAAGPTRCWQPSMSGPEPQVRSNQERTRPRDAAGTPPECPPNRRDGERRRRPRPGSLSSDRA